MTTMPTTTTTTTTVRVSSQSQSGRYCSFPSRIFRGGTRKLKKKMTTHTPRPLSNTPRCRGTDKEEKKDTKENNDNSDIRLDVRVNDFQLILGEVSLLWILELISRAVQVSLSPDFPGWLSPIESPTPNSIASMISATAWNFTWIGFSAMLGAYDHEDDYGPVKKGKAKRKTPTMKKLEEVSLTMLLYAPAQAFGDAFSLHANLLNLAATPPLLIRLPTTFAFIFAFRFYVLCRRGEIDQEIEESEFQLLYATLLVSLLATLCGAFTQTAHPQFHLELARELFQIVE
jgi:hypothetical protein